MAAVPSSFYLLTFIYTYSSLCCCPRSCVDVLFSFFFLVDCLATCWTCSSSSSSPLPPILGYLFPFFFLFFFLSFSFFLGLFLRFFLSCVVAPCVCDVIAVCPAQQQQTFPTAIVSHAHRRPSSPLHLYTLYTSSSLVA